MECEPQGLHSEAGRGLLAPLHPIPGAYRGYRMRSRRPALGLALGLAAFLLSGSANASAQGQLDQLARTTPEQRAKIQTLVMKEKLSLTEQQLPAVEKINLDTATAMQPVLESTDGPLIKMRKAREVESRRDTALQQALQPAQYQQWLATKEAIRQKAEEKLMEKKAGGGPS